MIDPKLQQEAVKYAYQNCDEIVKRLTDEETYEPDSNPISLFMAGSPGAGKTEFSMSFDIRAFEYENKEHLVLIDPDKIKLELPQYNGKNTDTVQKAATIIATRIYDHVLKHRQSVIVDTTFSHYEMSYQNVEKSIKRNRPIGIIYIYQDPIVAWTFTKIREKEEGRPVPKDFFINSFFQARDNVDRIKSDFGDKIKIIFVEKNFEKNTANVKVNVDKIENYVKMKYNMDDLYRLIV